jgi:hypothetical protein
MHHECHAVPSSVQCRIDRHPHTLWSECCLGSLDVQTLLDGLLFAWPHLTLQLYYIFTIIQTNLGWMDWASLIAAPLDLLQLVVTRWEVGKRHARLKQGPDDLADGYAVLPAEQVHLPRVNTEVDERWWMHSHEHLPINKR